jgi:pimeloyl-ACP methyl ester carboxylesterase
MIPRHVKRLRRRIACGMALRFPRLATRLPCASPLFVRADACVGPARELLVFLPGVYDVIEDYEAHGFLRAIRHTRRPIDMLLVDAHFGYYATQTVLDRLHEHVIAPARERYESIGLVGISMGGLGALLYTVRHPGTVARLALLAPFVGTPSIVENIRAAGGVRTWTPRTGADPEFQHELWGWVKQYDAARSAAPLIVLGYGLADRFGPGLGLLAEVLPPEHVFTSPGRHDWRTWSRLWRAMVPRLLPGVEGSLIA